MVGSFGSGARTTCGSKRLLVEDTQKIAAPPHRGLAREQVRVVVDDVAQVLEVVRQQRHRGGSQAYWRCPKCSRRCCALFIVQSVLLCRVCGRLSYRSRVLQKHRAVLRVAKLRKKLGAAPGLMGKLPPRPKHNKQAERYDRLARELAEQEAIVAGLLGGIVKALKRRKGRLHGPR